MVTYVYQKGGNENVDDYWSSSIIPAGLSDCYLIKGRSGMRNNQKKKIPYENGAAGAGIRR